MNVILNQKKKREVKEKKMHLLEHHNQVGRLSPKGPLGLFLQH